MYLLNKNSHDTISSTFIFLFINEITFSIKLEITSKSAVTLIFPSSSTVISPLSVCLLLLLGSLPTRRESSVEESSFSRFLFFSSPISDLLGIELRFSKLAALSESDPWLCSWIAVSSLAPLSFLFIPSACVRKTRQITVRNRGPIWSQTEMILKCHLGDGLYLHVYVQ